MASEYMFSVGTIGRSTRNGRKPSTLQVAVSHNRRAIQAELGARGHIDPAKTALNETICGPGSVHDVVALARSKMQSAGIDEGKLRKDYTQAIELLFSLPVGAPVNDGEYFRRCVEWVGERMGADNILSADIHRDEAAPHCHVLILPLVDGKMQGSSLVARKATAELRESFYREVAKPFGFKKPVDRMKGAGKAAAVRAVLNALESRHDPILQSALWGTVKQDIERNPAPYVDSLGVELQSPKPKAMRTMAQIFTSTGKGPKVEGEQQAAKAAKHSKPIGFEEGNLKPIGFEVGGEKGRNLSCVGFDAPTPSLSDQPTRESRDSATEPTKLERAQQALADAIARPAKPHKQSPMDLGLGNVSEGGYTRVRDDAEPVPVDW